MTLTFHDLFLTLNDLVAEILVLSKLQNHHIFTFNLELSQQAGRLGLGILNLELMHLTQQTENFSLILCVNSLGDSL